MHAATSSSRRQLLGFAFYLLLEVQIACASATISGTLKDYNGAVYSPPAEVTLKSSSGYSQSLVVSGNGRFELQVEPGTYWVTAAVPNCYPYRRAPLVVSDGQQINLDIVPRMRVLAVALLADGSDKATLAPKPKYDEIHLPGLPESALVEFTGKKSINKSGKIRYADAVLTYGIWTLEADVIEIQSTTKEIVLRKWFRITKGDARVEQGKTRRIFSAELEK